MLGTAESFSPTTNLTRGAPEAFTFFSSVRRFCRASMVDRARSSMLLPIVADHKLTRKSGCVSLFHMARVCSRKSGSKSTSASSRTRDSTAGRATRSWFSLSSSMLWRTPGVETRTSTLTEESSSAEPASIVAEE